MQAYSCRSMKPLLGHVTAGGPRKEIATEESRGVSKSETDCGSVGQNLRAYVCCIHEFKRGPSLVVVGAGMGKRESLSEFSQQIKQSEGRAEEGCQSQMLE